MTEQFVATNGADAADPASVPQKIDHDVLAQQEYAKVLQDDRVLKIMGHTATLYQLSNVVVIENQTQYDQVIDAFDSSKKLVKLIEERRIEIVGFPTKTIKLINGLFKQLKGNVDTVKGHFGSLIEAKKAFDKAQFDLGQAQPAEPEVVPSDDGVGTVAFAGEQEAPSNVVQSARGAKTHSRTDIEITITDRAKLLKAITGTNKRYKDLQDAIDELVEVNVGALKRIIKEGKRRTLPGVKIEPVSKTV